MDLVRYLRVLRRRWPVIAVLAVLGALAGAVVVPDQSSGSGRDGATTWIAVHTLFDSSSNLQRNERRGVATVTAEQAAYLVKSGDVPDRASQTIGGNPSELAANVVARSNANLGTIEITAKAQSPGEARKLADTFAVSLLDSVRDIQQRETTRNREILTAQIAQRESELLTVQGDDRQATTQRERLTSDIADKRLALQELDQRAQQGPNIYSFGSSEAFQVTPDQLNQLFRAQATQSNTQRRNSLSSREIRDANADTGGFEFNPLTGGLLGLALGGLAGVMLVLVINTLDPRIYTKEDAEEALGFAVIAEIPAFNRKLRKETIVISREAPYSRFAEAYRVLRSSVLFAKTEAGASALGGGNGHGGPPDPSTTSSTAPAASSEQRREAVVIMVTSPGPSEGKTTTVSNLATVLAEDGSSILVVNCDFRRPRLHSYLGGGGEPRKVFDTAVPGVKLVTGVVDEPERVAPAEVIGAQRRLITTARSHFDYILLDTAPILTTNDASELLPVVDMVVMICRSGKTTKESADRAAELLERFRAPVVGGVLVAAANAPTRQYYYYYAATPRPTHDESVNPLHDLRGPRQPEDERASQVVASTRTASDAGAVPGEPRRGDGPPLRGWSADAKPTDDRPRD